MNEKSLQDFADNLRLLCSFQKSVSSTAKDIGISRSQLNRYLSGKHLPTNKSLLTLCHYFNVMPEQICQDHNYFALHVYGSRNVDEDKPRQHTQQHIHELSTIQDIDLKAYEGLYYQYTQSSSLPEKYNRCVIKIICHTDGSAQYMRYSRTPGLVPGKSRTIKYAGFIFGLQNRLYLSDYEVKHKSHIRHTILMHSALNQAQTLEGIVLTVGLTDSRMPYSTNTVLEQLNPQQVSFRSALKNAGYFDLDSDSLSSYILSTIACPSKNKANR